MNGQEGAMPLPYPTTSPLLQPQMETNSDFFIYRIEGGDILEEFQHQLNGEVLTRNKGGGMGYEQLYKPWANKLGINKILYIINSCGINKNVFLGNLSKDEIYTRCEQLWIGLADMMFDYKKYGIARESRDLLIKSTVFGIHSGLSRSEGGKEASQLSTSMQKIEHTLKENRQGGRIPIIGNLLGKK